MLLDSSLIVHSRDPLFSLSSRPTFPHLLLPLLVARCILVAHERIMQVLGKPKKEINKPLTEIGNVKWMVV